MTVKSLCYDSEPAKSVFQPWFPALLPVPIEPIHSLIDADMRAVDAMIRRRLESDVVLIRQVAEYIIASGGKRLRPAILLLAAGATGYAGRHHHQLTAVGFML